MAGLPGGASELLVRDDRGKEADRLVTRIDPGLVSLLAELRGHGRRGTGPVEDWHGAWTFPEMRSVYVDPANQTVREGSAGTVGAIRAIGAIGVGVLNMSINSTRQCCEILLIMKKTLLSFPGTLAF